MDSSAMRSEMNRASAFTQASMHSLAHKAIHLLKANVYMAAFDLMRQVIPTAKEFWDSVYGTDEASMAKQNAAYEGIKKLKAEVLASRKALNDQRESQAFKNADTKGKEGILEGNLALNQDELNKANRNWKLMKDSKAGAEAVLAAEVKRNEVLKEREKLEQQLKELRGGMTFSELGESVARRLKAERKQIPSLRSNIAEDKASGFSQVEDRKALAANLLRQQNLKDELTGGITDTLRSISGLPFMGGLKGAIDKADVLNYTTMVMALKGTTMSVIIKGVDGP